MTFAVGQALKQVYLGNRKHFDFVFLCDLKEFVIVGY